MAPIPDDVTARLCREVVDGRLLTEKELVSILRNWTGGDLGSMALCAGVVCAYLADHPERAVYCGEGPSGQHECVEEACEEC